MKHYW